ncbi:MAG: glycosyltransferase [Pseudomonadota bacterium]
MASAGTKTVPKPEQTVWFTICARNYIAYAQTLFISLRNHHPDAHFVVFLADAPLRSEDLGQLTVPIDTPGFEIMAAADLGIPHFADMTVRYDVMELATAIKPDCFRHLFSRADAKRAIYLDPDIYVTSALDQVNRAFDQDEALVLTPHIRRPFPDKAHPDDAQIMRAGVYNLGFAAMRACSDVSRLLDWWSEKLKVTGHNDLSRGQFVDQRYMDLAPAFVERTHILRHAGYNAAYWNLHDRVINHAYHKDDKHWTADGDRLAFFHFSGVVPGNRSIFSKHQNRYERGDIGPLARLLDAYLDHLDANGQAYFSQIPYAYDHDVDGLPITNLMRSAFASRFPDGSPLSEPANTPAKFDIAWIMRAKKEGDVPPLLSQAWQARPDVQHAFSLETQAGRDQFTLWFAREGAQMFDLPSSVIDACTANFSGEAPAGAKAVLARGASRVLAAAPSLRPLYRHIPVTTRARVKTALFRAAATPGEQPAEQANRAATGGFDENRTPGVHLYGYLQAKSGIGASARGLAHLLDGANIPFGTISFSNPGDERESEPFIARKALRSGYRISVINANAEQVLVLDELIDPYRLAGTYRVGYWAWELARFPQAWISALDRLDEVWVPSSFVADSLRAVTKKPVHVLPHLAPDVTAAPQTPAPLPAVIPRDALIFLTALDLNSYLERKNPAATIAAFKAAFATSPDAPHLIIQINGVQNASADLATLRTAIAGVPHIHLLTEALSDDAFFALHRRADVFVSLHRAEGYGLNMAAAMAAGKPVIATDYSGNRDFMDETCAVPIAHRLIPVPQGAYPRAAGQVWAEPDHEAAVVAMRALADDPTHRATLGARASARIKAHSGSSPLRAQILARLADIDPALSVA